MHCLTTEAFTALNVLLCHSVFTFPVCKKCWKLFVSVARSSALITQRAHYTAGSQMLLVSCPPTLKCFSLSGSNGNSRQCVKFGPEEQRMCELLSTRLLCATQGYMLVRRWTRHPVSLSLSLSLLLRKSPVSCSFILSYEKSRQWCWIFQIAYSAGRGSGEGNRKTNVVSAYNVQSNGK